MALEALCNGVQPEGRKGVDQLGDILVVRPKDCGTWTAFELTVHQLIDLPETPETVAIGKRFQRLPANRRSISQPFAVYERVAPLEEGEEDDPDDYVMTKRSSIRVAFENLEPRLKADILSNSKLVGKLLKSEITAHVRGR